MWFLFIFVEGRTICRKWNAKLSVESWLGGASCRRGGAPRFQSERLAVDRSRVCCAWLKTGMPVCVCAPTSVCERASGRESVWHSTWADSPLSCFSHYMFTTLRQTLSWVYSPNANAWRCSCLYLTQMVQSHTRTVPWPCCEKIFSALKFERKAIFVIIIAIHRIVTCVQNLTCDTSSLLWVKGKAGFFNFVSFNIDHYFLLVFSCCSRISNVNFNLCTNFHEYVCSINNL